MRVLFLIRELGWVVDKGNLLTWRMASQKPGIRLLSLPSTPLVISMQTY